MKSNLILKIFFMLTVSFNLSYAQVNVERVEPPFWWVGMEGSQLQLLVQGTNLSSAAVKLKKKGVHLESITPGDHKDFVFLDLKIDQDVNAGDIEISFKNTLGKTSIKYELKEREKGRNAFNGLKKSDAVYLITPDRFVNGDSTNDSDPDMLDQGSRSDIHGRHGGDLAGIMSKIDYFKTLGVNTIWLNPVIENNMPTHSYHGYAITDYYQVDSRYGTNEDYKNLANNLHDNDMKLIMDMVFNHCGLSHWWMSDKPFKDWIHQSTSDTLMTTNFEISTVSDPYAADADKERMEKGWFVPSMPDLNHDNEFMVNYLIQNSIWWIEYAGLDGIRMDTYPYNKKEMMSQWADRVKAEYPDFYLLGETWVSDEGLEGYWSDKGANLSHGFDSQLDGISDFPVCYAMHNAFKEDGDIKQLYDVLSKDFLYHDPSLNNIFADNHDMDRFYHTIGQDLDAFRMAMTFLLTTRGVPQVYYGTEILMNGFGEHGVLRQDFPGGWSGDQKNAFDIDGRTEDQNKAFNHIAKLLKWRSSSEAIAEGTLKHFIPEHNVYVYNRKSTNESVLVLINNADSASVVSMNRYAEVTDGYVSGTDILTGSEVDILNDITIKANTAMVLRLEEYSVN